MRWFVESSSSFIHISTLEPEIREALLAELGESELPANTYYGDGEPIEPEVMERRGRRPGSRPVEKARDPLE